MPLGAFRLNTLARHLVPAAPSGLTLDAVAFTSADYYRHTTTITSATANKQMTMSCWFNVQQKSPRSVVFGMEPGTRLVAGPWLFNNTVDATGRFYAQTLAVTFDRTSSETNLYDINEWVHFAVAIDQTVPVIQMYINGQALTVSNVNDSDNFAWNDIKTISVNGRSAIATDVNNIKVSQVWMSNTFVDLSTNLSKFYDNGPVDLGSNGTATGLAQPLIYHYGDATTFPTNRGTLSYTFTTTGTPTSVDGPTNLEGLGLSDWSNFNESNITNKYTITSDFNIGASVAMDDTYGVISYHTNAAVNTMRTIPYTRSGSTLTFGTETTRAFTRGTDRTYSAVKMGGYAVFVADYGRRIISGEWTGGNNYTWGSEQVFSIGTLDRHSALAVNDSCLLVVGATSAASCVLRLFSRSGGTFTHQSDTTLNFTITGYLTQIIPCQDPTQFVVSFTDSGDSQCVLITVDPINYTVTHQAVTSALFDPFVSNTNSHFRVGQTITQQDRGNHGIIGYSKYVANYQYVDLVPFTTDGSNLTLHTANSIQVTDNTTGNDRPWSFDIMKLNSEWYILHAAYFDDSGNNPNRIRMYYLLKYNTANNTITNEYSWSAAPATQNLIISIRAWVSQLSDDYLLVLSNEDTSIGTVKAYVVPRV